jgi:hypothetical protein
LWRFTRALVNGVTFFAAFDIVKNAFSNDVGDVTYTNASDVHWKKAGNAM